MITTIIKKIMFFCIFVFIGNTGNAQTRKFDFSDRKEKSIVTIEISNYSDSVELLSVRKLTDTLFHQKSKIYFTIDENQKDVVMKFDSPERFAVHGPIIRVSDNKKYPFFFNTTTDILNKTVPLSLLVEFKDDNKDGLMETISKILKCQQIEDINKKDIEVLLKRSHAMTIITYKMVTIK